MNPELSTIPGCGGRYFAGNDGTVWSICGVGRFAKEHTTELHKRMLQIDKRGYFSVMLKDDRGKWKRRMVHQLILEAFVGPCPIGNQVDHINRNPADNRLCNLRWVTKQHNMRNCLRKSRHTKFRGLAYDPRTKKPWRAQCISLSGKAHHSKYFSTDREAAEAYDKLATSVVGNLAITNASLGLL